MSSFLVESLAFPTVQIFEYDGGFCRPNVVLRFWPTNWSFASKEASSFKIIDEEFSSKRCLVTTKLVLVTKKLIKHPLDVVQFTLVWIFTFTEWMAIKCGLKALHLLMRHTKARSDA